MKKVLLFVLPVTVLLTACSEKPVSDGAGKVIPVKTLNVQSYRTEAETNYIGTVEESFALSLSFAGMGTVEQILVSEGQKVNKGQLLATLNTTTAQNTVNAARASLRQAQDAYDRLSKLHDSGSLPDIKFVEVETGLQQAKSMLAMPEKNLGDCRLYASGSGIIAMRNIEPGENVIPGAAAFKLVSVDKVNVKITVPENEIGSIQTGQAARITVPALNNAAFTGKIETKGVTAHPITHTYEVKIRIDNTDHVGARHALPLPGMVCKVYMEQSGGTAAILVVPNRAIRISPDGKRFVWLADGDIARRCFVKTGELTGDGIVVTDGLPAGSKIIVEGFQKISEGMKISITD